MKHSIRKTLFAATIALASIGGASAATIELTPGERGEPNVITIEGEIITGDELTLTHLLLEAGSGVVMLDSPGGDLWPGLEMGRAIQLMGFDTMVPDGASCESACALLWLAGATRYMDPDGMVGFHAAYVESEDGALETGSGNAVIGAYLYALGMSFQTIEQLTSAPPDGMYYLTCDEAETLGIEVVLYREETGGAAES
jgi:hypothetical protein